MYEDEVAHASDRVRAVNSRGAILQNFNAIDHREGNQVYINARAETSRAQPTTGDTFSIDEHQGFFGQQTAQVELDGAVSTIADVLVDSTARLLRDDILQILGTPDTQFCNVLSSVGIDGIWPGFLRSRNVGTGDNNTLRRGFGRGRRRWCRRCRELSEGVPYEEK